MKRAHWIASTLALATASVSLAEPPADVQSKARFDEGETALRQSHFEDAIQAFEDAYRLSGKVGILYDVGLAYRRAFESEGRPEYLRRALDIYKTFDRLARTPTDRRAAEEAIHELEPKLRAVDDRERQTRLRVDSAGSSLQIPLKLFAAGRSAEALKAVEQLLARGHNPPSLVADLYRMEGEIAAAAGQPKVADLAFRRLLSLAPEFALPAMAAATARASLERARALAHGRPAIALTHVVPPAAQPDQPLALDVVVENDPLRLVTHTMVRYRLAGQRHFSSVSHTGVGDLTIPGVALPSGDQAYRVSYFLLALDRHSNILAQVGSTEAPLSFPVLSEADVARAADAGRPWYKRGWVWVGVGVAAAVVAGGLIALDLAQRGPPKSDFGVVQTLSH